MLLLVFSAYSKSTKPKFVNQTNFGFLLGENTKGVFTVQNFSGFAFKKYQTEIGLVLGFDNYHAVKIITLAFAAKYNFQPINKLNPFLMLSSGYGFGFHNNALDNESFKGGFMFYPSFGLKFNNKSKIDYHLVVGYKTQKAMVTQINDNTNRFNWFVPRLSTDQYLFRKVALTVGVSF